MARNLEELGALVILTPEAREPRRAAAQDRRDDRDAFDIVDGRRAAIKPRARRERRFQARLALLALEAFDHRGFFAADIGAGPAVDEDRSEERSGGKEGGRNCRSRWWTST